MCLGIPGKLMRWLDQEPPLARAEIEFGGVTRVCHMACVTDAEVGDYVLIHAGVAIARIDPIEAERIFSELEALGDDDGWDELRGAAQ